LPIDQDVHEATAFALIYVKHKSDTGRCQKRVECGLRWPRPGGEKIAAFDLCNQPQKLSYMSRSIDDGSLRVVKIGIRRLILAQQPRTPGVLKPDNPRSLWCNVPRQ
jgi:hypothetical protein